MAEDAKENSRFEKVLTSLTRPIIAEGNVTFQVSLSSPSEDLYHSSNRQGIFKLGNCSLTLGTHNKKMHYQYSRIDY